MKRPDNLTQAERDDYLEHAPDRPSTGAAWGIVLLIAGLVYVGFALMIAVHVMEGVL